MQTSARQGPRLVSELERLLGEPGCPACRYVSEIERSFFSWFQIESFSSPQVQAQLRAALGMCPAHSRRMVEQLGEGHIMTTVLREALAGALQHARGETQVAACPACESLARGSRRASQLVVDGLADPGLSRLYSDHGGMCLVHVVQTLPMAAAPSLKPLAKRLLGRLYEEVGPALVVALAGADDDAGRRARWRERLPELPGRGSTLDRLRGVIEIEACPVCLSTGVAERDYLAWVLAGSPERDQPLSSDPGELCPGHLHDLAGAGASAGVAFAAERKRAGRIAQLERFLSRLSQLPGPGRRARRGKPDGLDEVRAELLATPYCPACNARHGIERARLELITAALALAPVRERYERCHGLCLRHAMQMPEGHAGRLATRHVAGRLGVLAWEVGETARKYAWSYRHEASGPEHDAWMRGLAQIDGRVFAGAAPAGKAAHSPGAP